jgi:hypothetical protein
MEIEDIEGRSTIVGEGQMLDRLRSVRRGRYGAFILSHEEDGPSLLIHVNGENAYVHFLPDGFGEHAGFQSTSSLPAYPLHHFVQTDGGEANSFDISGDAVIGVDLACAAAVEFLHDGSMPGSIKWREL